MQHDALTQFIGNGDHLLHAIGSELSALDRKRHEHVLARGCIEHFDIRQIRPADFAGFLVFQLQRQRHVRVAKPFDLEASVDAAQVAQHEAHLVEGTVEIKRLALIQHQAQAPLIARIPAGEDPVGLIGVDRRTAAGQLPATIGAEAIDRLAFMRGRTREKLGECGCIAGRHRQAGQSEIVGPPCGRNEAWRTADGELARAGGFVQPHQIGGVAVDGEQAREQGLRARLGKPGKPALDVLQPFGRIADELGFVASGNPAPDAAHRNPGEHAGDVLLAGFERDMDRVPARFEGDGLGHVGGLRLRRTQQQREREQMRDDDTGTGGNDGMGHGGYHP